jgi:hypothetical protein
MHMYALNSDDDEDEDGDFLDSSGAIYADIDALHRRQRINRQPLL